MQNMTYFIYYHKNDYPFIVLICALFIILSFANSLLIFGVGVDLPYSWSRIGIVVVNNDQGNLGDIAINVIKNTTSFGWDFQSMNLYSVTQAIENAQYWSGIYIPNNFTQSVMQNLVNDVHTPGIINLVFDQGRRPYTIEFIRSSLVPYFNNVSTILTRHVIRSGANISRIENILDLVEVRDINLHAIPSLVFDSSLAIAYMTLLICITTFNSAIFSIYRPFEDYPSYNGMLLRLIPFHAVSVGFSIGLGLSLMVYRFDIYYGYVLLILFTLVVCLAYGGIGYFAFEVFGPVGVLILIVYLPLTNSASGAQLPITLAPDFYRIGYGLPYFNALEGARCIIYGSTCVIETNIAILLAWYLGTTLIAELWSSLTKKIMKNAEL